MAVIDLYSDRKRQAEGRDLDVLTYDLPDKLRVQIVYILRRAIGEHDNRGWQSVHGIVAEGHGAFALAEGRSDDKRCINFLLRNPSVDHVLDFIEVSFRFVDRIARKLGYHERATYGIRGKADESIERLNERFRRAGVGYQYEDGMIFRVDSDLVHAEVVRPALRFLHQQGFEGPHEEFLRAHACYRAGDMKEAVTNANNAFESTLKAICDQRRWAYAKGARASDLLRIVRDQGLLPDYLDNSFDQLAATLKSGLPKVRGEEGAHGQGAAPRKTPDHVAAYALHLAAAKIVFLVEAHRVMT